MADQRITQLTAEQQAALPKALEEWLAVGLATEPADREKAEAAAKAMYREINQPEPLFVFWLDSPFAGVLAAPIIQKLMRMIGKAVGGSQLRSQLRSQLYSQLDSQLRSQLRSQLYSQLRSQLRSQLSSQLYSQLRSQLRSQLSSQLRSQLSSQLYSQLRSQLYSQLSSQLYSQLRSQLPSRAIDPWLWGQFDTPWVAFYDFPERHWGVTYDTESRRRLDHWADLARSCGYWWALASAVVVTERPRCIHRDDENRLHAEHGSALVYPDGWGVWAWHGVRVDREVIEAPESLGAERITAEQNVEVRRVMIERYGADRYLREGDAHLLDGVHEPPFAGLIDAKLWRLEQLEDEPLVMLECRNSTPEPDGTYKPYFLRVPPQMSSAHEAAAWTFAETAETYQPVAES